MATSAVRVLVVDDDEPVRRLIRLNLELEGYEVEVAGDGRDCLRQARTRPPALITLDLDLPVLDGLSTAARLRASDRTRHIPLVLITGVTTPRDRIRAEALGIETVLAKPFTPGELVAAVRRVRGLTPPTALVRQHVRSSH